MTNQMEFSKKREKAARRCIEWQERLRCAEEDGDKELICYCRQKVEKYLAKIKKIKLEPDYKFNCRSKFDCQVSPEKNISRKKANTRD